MGTIRSHRGNDAAFFRSTYSHSGSLKKSAHNRRKPCLPRDSAIFQRLNEVSARSSQRGRPCRYTMGYPINTRLFRLFGKALCVGAGVGRTIGPPHLFKRRRSESLGRVSLKARSYERMRAPTLFRAWVRALFSSGASFGSMACLLCRWGLVLLGGRAQSV